MNKYTYVKKPVQVEAIQFTGSESVLDMFQHWGFKFSKVSQYNGDTVLKIQTLETHNVPLEASINDYIIKGVKDEFYPCKPDIFEETYQSIFELATYDI